MLNDLTIQKATRERFRRDTRARCFASRLPEPQDEDKVFRFERVQFVPAGGGDPVDYVSLSDGEHQLGQLLGTLCMLSFTGVMSALDEPESHFNPQWRVRCISRILDLPTNDGVRRSGDKTGKAAEQECILTTHVPSFRRICSETRSSSSLRKKAKCPLPICSGVCLVRGSVLSNSVIVTLCRVTSAYRSILDLASGCEASGEPARPAAPVAGR